MEKFENWKRFVQGIKNTVQASKRLSRLIGKYIMAKDDVEKRILSEEIDHQFEPKRIDPGNKGQSVSN